MNKVQNAMDCVYNIAKKKHEKDASFSFQELWKEVSEKLGFDQQKNAYTIGEFLGDMMQDMRFVRISSDRWKLREMMKFDEWDKISRSMSGTKEYLEEEYEDFRENEREDEEEEIDMDDLPTGDLEDEENFDRYTDKDTDTDADSLPEDRSLDLSDEEN